MIGNSRKIVNRSKAKKSITSKRLTDNVSFIVLSISPNVLRCASSTINTIRF